MSSLPWLDVFNRLNLNHLLGFMAVAETGSFRAAAARMHISQSALSVQVRLLEEGLGVPLFHRTTRVVSVTAEGLRLLAVARRLGEDLGQVVMELKEEAQLQRGVITVAVLPSLAASMMPRAMRDFAALHPGIDIRLRDGDSQQAAALLRQGDADMGVLSRSDALHEFVFTPLFLDEFVAVVPARGHALSARKVISIAALASSALLLNPRGTDTREVLETMFAAAGIVVRPTQELVGTHAMLALVEGGFGIGVLPEMALVGVHMPQCRCVKLSNGGRREIGVMLSAKRAPSPAVTAFKAFLQQEGPGYRQETA
ncbi:LysR family transcriptional regulator [Ottowia thiooxydans]|uniref:LysR family transcriptional regulator n=1 Tax=Ottowia thiooxydans TaxID=219182 RepID=UPI00041C2C63|nr:LysR family transcriptional regulator [Ottowia thiooxydans]